MYGLWPRNLYDVSNACETHCFKYTTLVYYPIAAADQPDDTEIGGDMVDEGYALQHAIR